uniref:Uncharacterized protein n=1 Tax=Globisporangium ultimum (strain ATCC 200006 / CBS 805.95 / DAOM BR144) TaxID=431595 RepID=K3X613_GLOUD
MKQVTNRCEELSDKEWRQMRRTLSKLEFEPVPETPALLPRSLYDEDDEVDTKQLKGDKAKLESANGHLEGEEEDAQSLLSNHLESPPSSTTRQTSGARGMIATSDT